MIDWVFLTIVILAGAAGDISVTRAMKAVGEVASFRVPYLLTVARRALRNRFIWLGVFWKAVAFFSLLALLARADLSWVVPATAVSFVIEVLAAKVFLLERVSAIRWAGVLCVGLGVALISL